MKRGNHDIGRIQTLLPYALGIAILARYVPVYIDGPVNVTLGRVAMVLVAVLGVAFLAHRPTILLTSGDIAFLLLFTLLTASTVWSAYPTTSINRVFDLSFYVLLYLGLRSYHYHSLDYPARPWTIFLIAGWFVFLVAVCYTLMPSIGGLLDINSNVLARYLIAFLPIFVVQAGAACERWVRAVFVAFSAGSILVMFLGGSRSGLLVLFVLIGPLVHLYVKAADRPLDVVATVSLLSLLGAMLTIFLFAYRGVDIALPLRTTLSGGINRATIGQDRVAMYMLIADLLPDHWLMGIGYGSFKPTMAVVHRKGFIVHNLFLRVWLGAGVLAVFLLGLVILRATRGFITQARRLSGSTRGVRSLAFATSLLGLVLMGQFNPVLTSPLFVTLLALGCSMPVVGGQVAGHRYLATNRSTDKLAEEVK